MTRGPRRGVALLVAIVTLVIVALCTLALRHTRASTLRSDRLRTATLHRRTQADSMLALAVTDLLGGTWRALANPGDSARVRHIRTGDGDLHATITRLGWNTILARATASGRSRVAGVPSRSDARLLVPLQPPIGMPEAALTSVQPWTIDPAAAVSLAVPTPSELRCRAGVRAQLVQSGSVNGRLDSTAVTLLDADTVTAPLVGVFRLIRDRITRPLVVHGMVESVTGLFVGADLQIVGVLVVQGSVQPAGGRLDVTGAVITRDSGGAGSVLGNGDRVRYDACAIRRAVERATRPAPATTWTSVGRF